MINLFKSFVNLKWKKIEHIKEVIFYLFYRIELGIFVACETRANEHPDSPNSTQWRGKKTRAKSILKPNWSARLIILFKYFVNLKWKKIEHIKEVIFYLFYRIELGIFVACETRANEHPDSPNSTQWRGKKTRAKSISKPNWSGRLITLFKYFVCRSFIENKKNWTCKIIKIVLIIQAWIRNVWGLWEETRN